MNEVRQDRVRSFFDVHSPRWLERYYKGDFDSVSYQDRMREALRLLEENADGEMLILDGGCGAGVTSEAIERMGHRVVACDIAPGMARTAAGRVDNVVLAALDTLPFPDRFFDGIVMLGVLGYANDPDAVMRTIDRVLKPGGLLIISTASERLLLERISDVVSYIPDRLYLAAKRLLTGSRSGGESQPPGFYKENCRYWAAAEFDRYIRGFGFHRLAWGGVNFGRLHFMGRNLLGEQGSIWLSRFLTRLSRSRLFFFVNNRARIYVSCFRHAGGTVA